MQPHVVITCEYRVNEIKIRYCISKKLCKFELVFQCWSSSCACQLIIASSKKRIVQIQHAVKKLTWWMLPETWFLWMPRTWIFGREQQHISVYDLNFVIEFKIATKLKNEKKKTRRRAINIQHECYNLIPTAIFAIYFDFLRPTLYKA